MSVSSLYSLDKANTARTLIGGDVIADTRNDLLRQVLVAVANKTSGGGGGSGTVTSVSFVGGLISVATATTTPALTVAGTSGGIPYFSSASTWASSAALAANDLVVGGGAGLAPGTVTTGTGILSALGINIGSAGAPVLFNGALGTPSSGTLTNCTGLPAAGVTGLGTMATQNASAVAITGGTIGGLTSFGVRSTGVAFDLKIATSEVLTANRTLSFVLTDADRSISLNGGNVSFVNAFTSAGNFATTITATATTNSTLPAGTDTLAGLGTAQTFSAANIFSVAGAAATPAVKLSGAWLTTTSAAVAQLLINDPTNTAFAGSANGTGLGINAKTAFTGNLLDAGLNGVTKFKVSYLGTAAVASGGEVDVYNTTDQTTNYERAYMRFASNVMTIGFEKGGTGGTRQSRFVGPIGGNVGLQCGTATMVWDSDASLGLNNSGYVIPNSDGVWMFSNNASSGAFRMQFAGSTSSFPALKRSSATLQCRLADDSAYATFDALSYSVGGTAGATGGTFTAITSITVTKGIITAITGT